MKVKKQWWLTSSVFAILLVTTGCAQSSDNAKTSEEPNESKEERSNDSSDNATSGEKEQGAKEDTTATSSEEDTTTSPTVNEEEEEAEVVEAKDEATNEETKESNIDFPVALNFPSLFEDESKLMSLDNSDEEIDFKTQVMEHAINAFFAYDEETFNHLNVEGRAAKNLEQTDTLLDFYSEESKEIAGDIEYTPETTDIKKVDLSHLYNLMELSPEKAADTYSAYIVYTDLNIKGIAGEYEGMEDLTPIEFQILLKKVDNEWKIHSMAADMEIKHG